MSDRVHVSVLQRLKAYRKDLIVLPRTFFTPWDGEREYIWYICEQVLTAEPIVHGLLSAKLRPHPVFSMTRRQANNWDRRIIEALDEARFINQANAFEEYKGERRKVAKQLDDDCEAWAKDHYKQWLRHWDEFSFAGYSPKDITRERKTYEDKHGKEFGDLI